MFGLYASDPNTYLKRASGLYSHMYDKVRLVKTNGPGISVTVRRRFLRWPVCRAFLASIIVQSSPLLDLDLEILPFTATR